MQLSIVLLTWNSLEFLPNCIKSLTREAPLSTEIIVVDNGSTDGSREFLQRNHPEIVLIPNKENKGVSAARNQGLLITKGKSCLVLDIDTIVWPGSLQALLHALENNPRCGLVGAKLLDINGYLGYSCRSLPNMMTFIYRQLPLHLQKYLLRKNEYRDWDHSQPRYVGWVIGACQMIRRSALEEIGLYDEVFFYGAEDLDYCLRMWKAGWTVLYEPNATITHIEQQVSHKRRLINPLYWIFCRSLIRYFRKHQYILHPPRFQVLGNMLASKANLK